MVRYTIHDEVDEVRHKLMQTWIVSDGPQGSLPQPDHLLIRVIVENRCLDLVEVQNQLLADNVLHRRF